MVDLVLANGVEVTTVEMVLERAGVDRAEFERHFDDKDDLYLKLFHEFSSAFERDVLEAFSAHRSWRDYELLLTELRSGRGTGSAEEFVPDLMYIAVRPYLGQQAALEELDIPPPPEGGGGEE